jgi:ubiquitin carboxyl-terminal hydrolase 7
MLIYVQQNKLDDILCPINENDIPPHLKMRFAREKEEEMNCLRDREIAHLYYNVKLVTDEHLIEHHGTDIGNYGAIKKGKASFYSFRILKTSTVKEFYQQVSQTLNLPEDAISLWKFDSFYGRFKPPSVMLPTYRPCRLLEEPNDKLMKDELMGTKCTYGNNVFYLEIGKFDPTFNGPSTYPKLTLPLYEPGLSVLAFIKLYDPCRRTFIYSGSIVFWKDKNLSFYQQEICKMTDLPLDAELNYYVVSSCRNYD